MNTTHLTRLKTAILFLIAIVVTGCGSGESRVEQGNRDGVLHMGNGSDPQSLDPHVATGVPENHIISELVEGLVRKNPYTLEVEAAAAKEWTISPDGLVYDFYLNENAKWSNGDPVTAEDFVWSWWRALQPKLGNKYVTSYYSIKNAQQYFEKKITDFEQVGVKAISEHHLQVTLGQSTPFFLQLLDHYSMYPVHRETLEKYDGVDRAYSKWTRPGNYIGNGPFQLIEWRLNKHIVLEPSPTYWGAEDVKLKKIIFYPIENGVTEERMFRAKQLHKANNVPIDKINVYKEKYPELMDIFTYLGTYFYRFNTEKKPLDDPRVRKALALSIDRETLIDTVLYGVGVPAYSFVPRGLPGYDPPKLFSYDPEQARKLLADAGFANGENFPKLELQYNTDEGHRKIAIAIQQMWKKELGVDIELANKDWKVYLDDEVSGNFEISRAGWIGDYVDPYTFMDMWFKDAGNNKTGWSSEKYDDLVGNKSMNSQNQKQRFDYLKEAEKILINDMPIIPVYFYNNKRLIHKSVKGMPTNIMDFHNFKYMSVGAENEE